MQDIEINSLLQGQSIHIENCNGVRVSVRHVEVEKVVEIGLAMLRLNERQAGGKDPVEDCSERRPDHQFPCSCTRTRQRTSCPAHARLSCQRVRNGPGPSRTWC